MSTDIRKILDAAIAAELLPPRARTDVDAGHPWPILLLTALGAWLAAVPLIIAVAMLFGDLLSKSSGPYLIGIPLLIGTVIVLRERSRPLFVEQLAIPALLVACASIAFGLTRHLGDTAATAWLGCLALLLAALLPRAWLRVLLGFAAAALLTWALILALLPGGDVFSARASGRLWIWVGLHLSIGAWLAALAIQARLGVQRPGIAAALEPAAAGWLIACLTGLCLLSGMTLLVGASIDPVLRDAADEIARRHGRAIVPPWIRLGSSLLVLGSGLWAASRWRSLAQPWILGATAAIAALAWLLPTLGAAWLALVVTLVTRRSWLAAFSALALAWIIGSFYYQLQWTLAAKALALASVGLLLAGLAWLGSTRARRGRDTERKAVWSLRRDQAAALITLTALATLGAANLQILEKEALIADGRRIYVELVPVDPRSLVQGDFMRLRFPVPGAVDRARSHLSWTRPRVVARIDDRGVATLQRIHSADSSLAEDELLIELTPKDGRWTLVTDAWFFREGEAQRWQAARFGEFRVDADGTALLVGMADAELRAIDASDGAD